MADLTIEETEGDGAKAPVIASGRAEETTGGPDPISEEENSSSSSDSDDEAAELLQVETLERALASNPMDYESHVEYIRLLRKLGNIEKLRQARESMNERFPLSPEMWLEWVKDEVLLSPTSESFAEIEKLYERGVHEYLFVPLWCNYLDFVKEHDPLVCQCALDGLSKMRNLFERALTAAGLHIIEGNKIWKAYREYEEAILLKVSDGSNEERTRHVQRIRSLFHRQLSVPLVDLRSTLLTYKHWEVQQGNANDDNSELDGVPKNVASAYQKALEMYNVRSPYEKQLSNCGVSADGLEQFKKYIKFEESVGDPGRVQILYERAVSDYPVSSDLWSEYTSYLDRSLKIPSVLKDVYSRATRNCTWVGDLWVRYMLSLERMHSSEKELSDVFEQSMRCSFPSFKEYMDLFLTRVDGLRRRLSLVSAKEDGLDYTLIRETFQRAADYFSPQQLSTDDLLRLNAYWARLEAKLGKDLVAACGVWESLIKKSGAVTEVWQSYIAMEIEMGHIDEARSLYKRCYNRRFLGTGSEDICHSWLRFEREYGTLDDLDLAVKKVTPRLKELMMFKIRHESKSVAPFSAKEESSVPTNSPNKRKATKKSNELQPSAKKQRDTVPKSEDSSYVDLKEKSGKANDAGGVEVMIATSPKVVDAGASQEKPTGHSRSNELKPNLYTDRCTAFVSNISLAANEDHLCEFFMECGGATAVRLLKDKFTGKSRGLAYVDFSNDEHLAAAVAKNRQTLLGKKLSIARSDPNKKRASANSHSSSELGRGGGGRFRGGRGGQVKPLGWRSKGAKPDENIEKPKSNDEFREMLLRK